MSKITTTTVLGVRLSQNGGQWLTDDGYTLEPYEGYLGGWSLWGVQPKGCIPFSTRKSAVRYILWIRAMGGAR